MNYAILDVETTGGQYNEEGIIEIAVYRFDGEKITDTFISLVNPEKEISFFVQKLTGITPKMVKTAPKFHELAKRLVEITDEATIVAHNVNFDYRVIRTEFSHLGFDFVRPTLDTIALSKTLIPGIPSYSLGKLCSSLGIPLSDRHRAHGDARATVKLFQLLLDKDSQKNIIQTSIKHIKYPSLNKKIIRLLEELPQETGVFYFHNKEGKIIYIDNDTNISNKARQILTGKGKRTRLLQLKTETISYEITGNDIISLVKAQNEIKLNQPEFKPRKNLSPFIYGIFKENSNENFTIFPLNKTNKKRALLAFSSYKKAQNFINQNNKKDYLFSKNLLKKINPEIQKKEKYVLLSGKGRTLSEKSFLWIEKGVLKGYGYYSLHSQIKNIEKVKKIMIPAHGNHYISLLIRNKLFVNKGLNKIIY